jgi:hypothetical protein
MKSLSLFPGESVSIDDSSSGDYDISLWYTHDYSPTYWKLLTQRYDSNILIDNAAISDIYTDGSAFPLEITRANTDGQKIIIKNIGSDTVFVADVRLYNSMPEYSEINKHSKTPSFGFFQLANDANVGLSGNAITDTLSVFKKNADDTSYTRGNLECNELDASVVKSDTIVARNELLNVSGNVTLDYGNIHLDYGNIHLDNGDLTIEKGDVTIREGSKLHFIAQPASGYGGVTFDMSYGSDGDESGLWNEHIKMISGLSSATGRGQEEFCRILRKNDGVGNERRTELYLNPTSTNASGQCKKVWIGSDTTHGYAVFGSTIFRSHGQDSTIDGTLYIGETSAGVGMWQNPMTSHFGGAVSLWGNYTGDRGSNNKSPNYGMWVQQDHTNEWYTKINGTSGVRILAGTDLSLSIWKVSNHAGLSFASTDDRNTNGGWGNLSYVYSGVGEHTNGYLKFDSSNNANVMEIWSTGVLVLKGAAFMSGNWGYGNHLWIGHASHRNSQVSGNYDGYTILTNPEGDSLLNCVPGRTTYIRVGNGNKIVCDASDTNIYGNVYFHGGAQIWNNSRWEGLATYAGYPSDDRLKMNEKNISNASPLLAKLRPQVYDKLSALDGNVEDAQFEAGLIAQEIWYDCPELRHLVKVGEGGSPADAVETSSDPSVDPDYSSWGPEPASVNYTGFIPYLIRGFQEQHEEVDALKKENAEMKAQIAMLMKSCGLADSGNVESV